MSRLTARCIIVIAVMTFGGTTAQAQCRMGSGPDQGDGIPWCSAPSAQVPQPESVSPAQWHDMAAAIAWADSDKGSQFIGVEKYVREAFARERALEKCREKGWENCEVAASVTNGVIAIARDNNRSLRTSIGATKEDARERLRQQCDKAGVSCKILAAFDGSPDYF